MGRPLLLRLLLCLAVLPCAGQDAALRDTFLQAKSLWSNQGDREGAAGKFELLIAALEPKGSELAPDWRQTLCEAYNWLAVLDDRSSSNKPRAAKNLEAAITLDPDFDIDRSITPARLQAVFDGLRSSKLVKVQLTFKPDGGSLTLDGKPTSLQALKYIPLGSHKLAYRRPGFATVEQSLEAAAGSSPALVFDLQRTSSTIKLYINPSGAEVFLDGKSLGKTSGSAGAEALLIAEKGGVKPEELSAPFIVTDLVPGDHIIELKAPCHRTKRIALPKTLIEPFDDRSLEAILLEPAKGSLALTSLWEGGEIFLDGERRGILPMAPLAVCEGTYALEVRFPSGGFAQTVEVVDRKTLSLAVKPMPRLAFVGLEGEEDFTGRGRLQAQLLALGSRLKTVAFLPRMGQDAPQEALVRLKSLKEAELFLRVQARKEGSTVLVDLVLSTPENEEERIQVKPLETDPLGHLVARLNHLPALQRPWAGLSLLDLPGQPGPWVLQADEVAVKAGIQNHQAITRVNGQAVANVLEFKDALLRATGERVKIGQGTGDFELPAYLAVVELPVSDPACSYPFLLAELRLRLLGAKGESAAMLRFQQALALLHFRKYEKAVELLRDIRSTRTAGVCQGTIDYYMGLCLVRLGHAYSAEAIQAFTQALKYPAATLFGPEGPLVAPLAKQAIEDNKLN